jgi:hypothetical protein
MSVPNNNNNNNININKTVTRTPERYHQPKSNASVMRDTIRRIRLVPIRLGPDRLPPAPTNVTISVAEALRPQTCRSCNTAIDHHNHQPTVIITYPYWVTFRASNGTRTVNQPKLFMHCICFKAHAVKFAGLDAVDLDPHLKQDNPLEDDQKFQTVAFCEAYCIVNMLQEAGGGRLKISPHTMAVFPTTYT